MLAGCTKQCQNATVSDRDYLELIQFLQRKLHKLFQIVTGSTLFCGSLFELCLCILELLVDGQILSAVCSITDLLKEPASKLSILYDWAVSEGIVLS